LADELAAYNPLIPQGRELVATVMFEVDNAARREAFLATLGGVEHRFFLDVGKRRIAGQPEGDTPRTREDGKASSVHFLRFSFTDDDVAAFRDPVTAVRLGCDHPAYAHIAGLPAPTRTELAGDFA
jgi:hypothetical protein